MMVELMLEATLSGTPLVRALFLHHPSDPVTWSASSSFLKHTHTRTHICAHTPPPVLTGTSELSSCSGETFWCVPLTNDHHDQHHQTPSPGVPLSHRGLQQRAMLHSRVLGGVGPSVDQHLHGKRSGHVACLRDTSWLPVRLATTTFHQRRVKGLRPNID